LDGFGSASPEPAPTGPATAPRVRSLSEERRRAAELGLIQEDDDDGEPRLPFWARLRAGLKDFIAPERLEAFNDEHLAYDNEPSAWARLHRFHAVIILVPLLVVTFAVGAVILIARDRPVDGVIAANAQTAKSVADDIGLPIPQIEPVTYADMTPEAAQAWNESNPIDATLKNFGAAPFRIPNDATADYTRALDCLTAAIHYEAATQGPDGMRAVAQVVINRTRHPAFPHNICGVVFQGANLPTGCQFTFTCDGSLDRPPNPAAWAVARQFAVAAISGSVYPPVGMATHYHTVWVVPYWAKTLSKIGNVGAHIFYKWKDGWGQPAAFKSSYARPELDVVTMYGVGKAPFHDETLLVSDESALANFNAQNAAREAEAKAAPAQPDPEAPKPAPAVAEAPPPVVETPKAEPPPPPKRAANPLSSMSAAPPRRIAIPSF
jgi:spore germination cell wall hydrolase CwlJ-like protein